MPDRDLLNPIMINWNGEDISVRELSLFTDIPYETLVGRLAGGDNPKEAVRRGGSTRKRNRSESYTKRKPPSMTVEQSCALWDV